jgi:hypothetical protein
MLIHRFESTYLTIKREMEFHPVCGAWTPTFLLLLHLFFITNNFFGSGIVTFVWFQHGLNEANDHNATPYND